MNSVSSKKQNTNIDSPKTPGGISRSLLTPCRRVGLSRKFNKKGSSPFISPLSNSINSPEVTVKKEQKKRKSCMSEDELELLPKSSQNDLLCTPDKDVIDTNGYECIPSNISKTPSRNILHSKKKSRTLLVMKDVEGTENICGKAESAINSIEESPNVKDIPLSKLARSNSKRKIKQIDVQHPTNIQSNDSIKSPDKIDDINISSEFKNDNRDKSPNKLTKECIVVIQKKMLKNLNCSEPTNKQQSSTLFDKTTNSTSQTLFDSDSDDMPLCNMSKRENINKTQDDDDFIENDNVTVKKKQNKITSNKGLKISNNYRHTQQIKPKTVEIKVSQSSFDDDDDFECVKKNTIIVKKSYDKVSKPLKAKSTGSITQKDIDELKARIEMKKKLLIAKAMTEDTTELRNLIKKWQKGCQEALFELFDLMRNKFPERQNMDYSEILQTLKIPPELVGYDVENDCFVTPDDSSIILSSIHT